MSLINAISNLNIPNKQNDLIKNNIKTIPNILNISNSNLKGKELLTEVIELTNNLPDLYNTLKNKNIEFQQSLCDFLLQNDYNNEYEFVDEEKNNNINYVEFPFLPVNYFKVNITQPVNNELDNKTREELEEIKNFFKSYVEALSYITTQISKSLTLLCDNFGFNNLSNFSNQNKLLFPNIDEEYYIMLFYLGTMAKSGTLTFNNWQDIRKKALKNEFITLPNQINEIYKQNFTDLLNFANNFCRFPSQEYLHTQAKYLCNLIVQLEKLFKFSTSLEFPNDINEIDILSEIGGPDYMSYFEMNSNFLKTSGAIKKPKENNFVKNNYQNISNVLSEKNNSNLCLKNFKNLDWVVLKEFFQPFGNIITSNNNDSKIIINEEVNTFNSTNLNEKITFDEFKNKIDLWKYFFSYLKLFFNQYKQVQTNLNNAFDSIYKELVNSVYLIGNSLEIKKLDYSKIKYPIHLSFRDGAILLNLQNNSVSNLPLVLLLDDFNFSSISLILTMYAIGYFQEKQPNSHEEKYFNEILTSPHYNILNNLVIVKILDFVLSLAYQSINSKNYSSFGNFIIDNRETFDLLLPHIYSATSLIESSTVDFTHRSANLNKLEDSHIMSQLILNFLTNFTTSNNNLGYFNNSLFVSDSIEKIIGILFAKSSELNFKPAQGKRKNDNENEILSKKKKIDLKNKTCFITFLFKLHNLNESNYYIYEYDDIFDMPVDIQNISLVPKNQIVDLNESFKCYKDFFIKYPNEQSNKYYYITKIPLKHRKNIDIDIFDISASKIFIPHIEKDCVKLVHYMYDLYVVKSSVNFSYLLNLRGLLNREYNKKWKFSLLPASNVIPVRYTFIDDSVNLSKIPIDEFLEQSNISNQTILIEPSDEINGLNLTDFFSIDYTASMYKIPLNNKIYNYYLNFDKIVKIDFNANFSVMPNFPEKKLIDKIDVAGAKCDFKEPLFVENFSEKDFMFNQNRFKLQNFISNEINKPIDIQVIKEYDEEDDLIIFNSISNYMDELRKILCNFEINVNNLCSMLIPSVKLRLLENMAIQHFIFNPAYYLCNNIYSEIYNHYKKIDIFYANCFTIYVDQLNTHLQLIPDTNSSVLQKLKIYYSYLTKINNQKNFGTITIPQNTRYGPFFFHLSVLYLINSLLKKDAENNPDSAFKNFYNNFII